MTPLVWKMTVDTTDAIRQVQAFAGQAADASRSAPPVVLKMDVTAVVKGQQQVEAAAAKAAAAAERAANREAAAWVKASQDAIWAAEKQEAAQIKAYDKAASEAETAAKRAATAQQQLTAMAAGTTGEKASSAFATKEAEIKRLLAITGDQVTADKALKLAQQDVARGLVQQGPAAEVAARGYNRANAGAMNLFHQLRDIGAGLASGQSPMMVLTQQLPQVADSFEMGGGAAATMGSAIGTLETGLTALAAVAVPLTITVGALAAAYSVVANTAMTTTAETDTFNQSIYQQGLVAGTTEAEVKKLDDAWKSFSGSMQDAQTYVATVNGDLEEWEIKAGKAARAVRDGTEAQIKAQADNVASLKQQKDAVQGLIDSEETSSRDLPELFARRKAINNQLTEAIPALEQNKKAVEDTTAAVIAAADKEEKDKEAKEAATKAHKGHTAALKEETEWLRRMNEAMAAENALAQKDYDVYTASIAGIEGVGDAAQARMRREKTASEQIVTDYDDQIKKIKELEQAAMQVSTTEAGLSNAKITADKASADAEEAMLARLSDMREKAATDGLAMQNATAAKQAEIQAKGQQDSKDIANQYRSAAESIAGSVGQMFSTVLDKAMSAEVAAAQAAQGEVDNLKKMMDDLSTETVDAASLSGKALEDAYKAGKVAAGDLTDAQKAQLSTRLKAEEKAAQKEADGHKKAAMTAWDISQAAAAATAVVNTALAISSAMTLPPPASYIAAGIAGAAGIAAEVEIATAAPPSFRGGGMVTGGAGMAGAANTLPDVRIASVELGESINNRRGTQNLGGEDGVKQNNAGIPNAPHVTNLMLRHEVLDRVFSENAQRPSATRTLLARHKSRSNPYLRAA